MEGADWSLPAAQEVGTSLPTLLWSSWEVMKAGEAKPTSTPSAAKASTTSRCTGWRLRLQNKQGKSDKAPFPLHPPFFSTPHRNVLVSQPLLALSQVRGFLNKRILTNLLLLGKDGGEGICSLDPSLGTKQDSMSSRVQKSGVDTARGGERKKIPT